MFLWCPVIENDSIHVVHQVLCLKIEPEPACEISRFFKNLDDGQSTKKEDCPLTSLMLCYLSLIFDPYPVTLVRHFHSEERKSHKAI